MSGLSRNEAKLHTNVPVVVSHNKELFSCDDHAPLCSTKIGFEGLLMHRIIIPSRFRMYAILLLQFIGNVKVVRRGWSCHTKFEAMRK
jgi:hypothetical protein